MTRQVKVNLKLLAVFLEDNDKPDYEALARQFNCSEKYLMRLKGQMERSGLLFNSNLTYHIFLDLLRSNLISFLVTIKSFIKRTPTKLLPHFTYSHLYSFVSKFSITLTTKEVSL